MNAREAMSEVAHIQHTAGCHEALVDALEALLLAHAHYVEDDPGNEITLKQIDNEMSAALEKGKAALAIAKGARQ